MRPEDVLFDGITNIREELIEEAQQYVFRKRVQWMRYAGLAAACLLLALGLNLLSQSGGFGGSADSGGTANSMVSSDAAPTQQEKSFIADVLEVNDDGSLLVVPQPGSGIWSVADRVTVPVDAVWKLDVQPGDQVQIFYTGEAGENFVKGVVEIIILN